MQAYTFEKVLLFIHLFISKFSIHRVDGPLSEIHAGIKAKNFFFIFSF